MRQIFLLITINLTLVAVASFLFLHLSYEQPKESASLDEFVPNLTTSEEVEFWMKRIEEKGGFVAHEEFSSIYQDYDYHDQHEHAHVFGEAVFKTLGVDGIVVCDQNFGFGCYHSFFGWTLLTHGIEIIGTLDEACIATYGEKGLGCQHGIGHGLLVELGPEKLNDALALCSTLNWQGGIGGCTGGVFMEFNFNTMGETGKRLPPNGDYHYPCADVMERYKEACYFEMAPWWGGSTGWQNYELIGQRCNEAPTTRETEACLRGLGNNIAGMREFNVDELLAICGEMPDRESELLCIEGATWNMANLPQFEDTWTQMCEELEGSENHRCLESKDFI